MSDNGLQSSRENREVTDTPRSLKGYHAPVMEAFGEVGELTQASTSKVSSDSGVSGNFIYASLSPS